MNIVKFPVVVWHDDDGCYTAQTLAGPPGSAVDRSVKDSLAGLKQFLAWGYRRGLLTALPDLDDLRLVEYVVTVRPRHKTEAAVFPCDRPVDVRVPGVLGRCSDRTPMCVLPTLGLRLSCPTDDRLEELIREAAEQALSGLSPAELVARLPPRKLIVESINVKTALAKSPHGEPPLSTLRSVADPLGGAALRKAFGRAWQRDNERDALVGRLQTDKANLLLVGPEGVGKTTLLANAVRQLERLGRKDKRPEQRGLPRAAHRYWFTSGARLIAGMQYLGQWEARCETLIDELSEIDGVFCIENLLELVRAGGCEPTESVAAFFASYLERAELRVVSEATPAELDACRRLLPSLAGLFQVVRVEEFQPPQATAVLNDLTNEERRRGKLTSEAEVAETTYRLFRRFLPYQPFPGQCTAFLRDLFERQRRLASKAGVTPILVTREDVLARFQIVTGLADVLVRDSLPLVHADVVAALERQVIGQPAACQAAAGVVTRFKAGLNDPQRPLGVLLFCGPTGVGKTELARTLAEYLFGAGQAQRATDGRAAGGHSHKGSRLIRLDMSEYSGFGSAERLLMQPNGQPSELIKQIRQQPFAVVLLDEIEKAAPEVFDVLLSLLDEGRLTDRYGRTAVFKSAVIVMTSNLGASVQGGIGFEPATPAYERAVLTAFRPEFFNRIDSVVTFNALTPEVIEAITLKELNDLGQREGFTKAKLRIEWSPRLVSHLAAAGFDARYGARPLQRAIEKKVVAPLARWLVEHAVASGMKLRIDLDDAGNISIGAAM